MRIAPLAAAVAALALIAVPAAEAHKPKHLTLSYETKLTSLTPVPISGQTSEAPAPGDYVVITDEYLNAKGKVVGTDVVHCILITTKQSLCNVAVQLPKGQLELQGIGPAGGTGRLRGGHHRRHGRLPARPRSGAHQVRCEQHGHGDLPHHLVIGGVAHGGGASDRAHPSAARRRTTRSICAGAPASRSPSSRACGMSRMR
jgi:hypothetical protein